MKVECKISPACKEPYAILHLNKMTPGIGEAISLLEREGKESSSLMGIKEGKTYFLEPQNLDLVRAEGRDNVGYDRSKNRYVLSKPLYELEKVLGNSFFRISKSTIINIKRIDYVKASFNGTMELVMKNGVGDYISRSYRKSFKERLGLI